VFSTLLGKEAFWQLSFPPHNAWTFSFSRELPLNAEWTEEKSITGKCRPDVDLRQSKWRDEFESLPEINARRQRARWLRKELNFVWPAGEPEALRPLAEENLADCIYKQTDVNWFDLCARCDACALKIYQAVAGMLRADLFASATVRKS